VGPQGRPRRVRLQSTRNQRIWHIVRTMEFSSANGPRQRISDERSSTSLEAKQTIIGHYINTNVMINAVSFKTVTCENSPLQIFSIQREETLDNDRRHQSIRARGCRIPRKYIFIKTVQKKQRVGINQTKCLIRLGVTTCSGSAMGTQTPGTKLTDSFSFLLTGGSLFTGDRSFAWQLGHCPPCS